MKTHRNLISPLWIENQRNSLNAYHRLHRRLFPWLLFAAGLSTGWFIVWAVEVFK